MEFLVELRWDKTKNFVVSLPREQAHALELRKKIHKSRLNVQKEDAFPVVEDEIDSFVGIELINPSATHPTSSGTTKRIMVNAIAGVLNAFQEDFLTVVTGCEYAGTASENAVYRITGVAFYSLQDDKYDKFWNAPAEGQSYRIPGTFPSTNTSTSGQQPSATSPSNPSRQLSYGQSESLVMHPCYELAKFLSSGTFYFSYHTNLACVFGNAYEQRNEMDEFVWNWHMLRPFSSFFEQNSSPLEIAFVSIIQGFFKSCEMLVRLKFPGSSIGTTDRTESRDNSQHNPRGKVEILNRQSHAAHGSQRQPSARMGILSKVSWKRAGTRLQSRGCNDEGNVSNFVYTTLFFDVPNCGTFTFDIIRGSVPLFWEQVGLQFGQHRIQILRSFESSQEAFDKHFSTLLKRHGYIFIIDLLSQSKSTSEYELSNTYRRHLLQSNNEHIGYTCFDFNSICKTDFAQIYILLKKIMPVIQKVSYNYKLTNPDLRQSQPATDPPHSERDDHLFAMKQEGVIRVNCMDCLDRTNVVQSSIAKEAFFSFCRTFHHQFSIPLAQSQISSVINSLWADNGDAISQINTGTAALKSGLTRTGRRSLMEYVDDMAKAAQRLFINAFQDRDRQQIIDLLLGRYPDQQNVLLYDPLLERAEELLLERKDKFESWIDKKIFCVTWNVGGLTGSQAQRNPKMSDLFHQTLNVTNVPDMVVICLQEIVPLSASSLIQLGNNAQLESRKEWELVFASQLSNTFTDEIFQLIYSNQLVGIALFIWVKRPLCPFIRGLEGCTKKTGLKGMTGNKGAIVCRFELHNSSFCFVGSHFAAGQDEVQERNMNWQLIMQDTWLSWGKRIENHHAIVWMGDLNYRINLEFYQCATLASRGQFSMLWRYDQLQEEMKAGRVFRGFKEGELVFYPTYRYVLNEDGYADDEKQRVPSWTDRILFAGLLTQLGYTAIQSIRLSDHRPVAAMFNASVRIVDIDERERILNGIIIQLNRESNKSEILDETGSKSNNSSKAGLISFDEEKLHSFETALNKLTLE